MRSKLIASASRRQVLGSYFHEFIAVVTDRAGVTIKRCVHYHKSRAQALRCAKALRDALEKKPSPTAEQEATTT